MFARFTGHPRGAAPGFRKLGTAVGFCVGGETAGGKGQSTAARVGAELGLAAEETLGLAADAVEEGDGAATDGAAAGGRTTTRTALSTASVASTTAAATRRRGQDTIGLDRSAFMLRQA
jgi:hypothetical protein